MQLELFWCHSKYSDLFMVVVEWILHLKIFGVGGDYGDCFPFMFFACCLQVMLYLLE